MSTGSKENRPAVEQAEALRKIGVNAVSYVSEGTAHEWHTNIGFMMRRNLWKYLLLLLLIVVVNDLAAVLLGPRPRNLVSDSDREALLSALPPDVRQGNSAKMFYDFGTMVKDLIQAVDSARRSIDISFYHFEDDSIGNCVADHLIDRVRDGVEVRFLYDGTQLRRLGLYDRMSDAGIEVRKFNPMYVPWLMRNDFSRNHQKIVVIDGHTGYTGGMNIADRYSVGLGGRPWVDVFMRLDGPASLQMREIFAEAWSYAGGEGMDMEPSAGSFIPGPEMVPLDDVEILSSGAFGAGPRIMERYCEMLDKSCRFAYFESPYFIPAGPLLDAMKRAAERGVDVRVIYPARCDLSCVYDLCSASFVAEALESGVRIGQYAPGFLHSKMFVTDDIACVGSANLDSWSLCRNLEIMVFVHDASFADELLGHFRQDESLVTYLDETEWARRPFRQRVGERTWRILRHVL